MPFVECVTGPLFQIWTILSAYYSILHFHILCQCERTGSRSSVVYFAQKYVFWFSIFFRKGLSSPGNIPHCSIKLSELEELSLNVLKVKMMEKWRNTWVFLCFFTRLIFRGVSFTYFIVRSPSSRTGLHTFIYILRLYTPGCIMRQMQLSPICCFLWFFVVANLYIVADFWSQNSLWTLFFCSQQIERPFFLLWLLWFWLSL